MATTKLPPIPQGRCTKSLDAHSETPRVGSSRASSRTSSRGGCMVDRMRGGRIGEQDMFDIRRLLNDLSLAAKPIKPAKPIKSLDHSSHGRAISKRSQSSSSNLGEEPKEPQPGSRPQSSPGSRSTRASSRRSQVEKEETQNGIACTSSKLGEEPKTDPQPGSRPLSSPGSRSTRASSKRSQVGLEEETQNGSACTSSGLGEEPNSLGARSKRRASSTSSPVEKQEEMQNRIACIASSLGEDPKPETRPCSRPQSSPGARSTSLPKSDHQQKSCQPADTDATRNSQKESLATNRPAEKKKSIISGMSQTELVAYSLQRDDLLFAGSDIMTMRDLTNFRKKLGTETHPFDDLKVEKFIAKGTAGWVFAAHNRNSTKVALKLIRMTQARSGVREWYVSKFLRSKGVANVVLTEDNVRVVARDEAPLIIDVQLQDAGPCNYYMCLTQEFMDGGSFEDLMQAGLSLGSMFKVLEDVAATLSEMHKHSVQHLDIKPENIMLVMKDDEITGAKLCDLGRAEMEDNQESRRDDIRRFGLTLYSVASGENWTSSRLLHAEHATLVSQLTELVADSPSEVVRRLPAFLQELLAGKMEMCEAYTVLKEMRQSYDNEENPPSCS